MKFLIFMTLLSAIIVIKSVDSMSIGSFLSPHDDPLLPHKFHQPELIRISVRRLAEADDEMNSENPEGKQIPVISDIERIKKVVEIIEFVGEKVGELIDKIDIPSTPSSSDYIDERKATENPQGDEIN